MLTSKSFLTDFRQSVRGLWREKAFTLTILATFALCLGANVVIFTVLHAVVLKPLPFQARGAAAAGDRGGAEGAAVRVFLLMGDLKRAGIERVDHLRRVVHFHWMRI